MGQRRGEGGGDGRGDLRPAERRRRVPRVFDRRRVVGVDAPDRVLAEQLERVGVADVGRVEADRSADRIAGDLDERAEIAVELAGDEAGDLLGDEIVVGVQARRGRRVLRRIGVGEAGHVHGRDRRALPVAAAQRIAADLEAAAERRQFRKGGVAGGAGLAGLAGVARQGFGRAGADGEERRRSGGDGDEGRRRQRRVSFLIAPNAPAFAPNRRCRHSAPLRGTLRLDEVCAARRADRRRRRIAFFRNLPCEFCESSYKLIRAAGPGLDRHPAFLTHSAHQPVGEIVPSTLLQAFGATKRLQPLHCLPSFGEFLVAHRALRKLGRLRAGRAERQQRDGARGAISTVRRLMQPDLDCSLIVTPPDASLLRSLPVRLRNPDALAASMRASERRCSS